MKKLFFVLIFSLSIPLFGQNKTEKWEIVGNDRNYYYTYSMSDKYLSGFDSSGFAQIAQIIGDKVLRLSSDAGKSWTNITIDNLTHRIFSLSTPTKKNMVICGDSSELLFMEGSREYDKYYGMLYILKENNTFEKITVDSNSILLSIKMQDSVSGAVYSKKTNNYFNPEIPPDSILITHDYWKTWKSVSCPSEITWAKKLFYKSPYIRFWGLSKSDKRYRVFYSDDEGKTWANSNPINETIYDVFFLNEKLGWAVGSKQKNEGRCIYKTNNGGKDWRKIEDSLGFKTRELYGIAFSDENNGFACGGNFSLIKTTDGGESWETCQSPEPRDVSNLSLLNIAMTNKDHAMSSCGTEIILGFRGESIIPYPDLKVYQDKDNLHLSANFFWNRINSADYELQIVEKEFADQVDGIDFFKPLFCSVLNLKDNTYSIDTLKYNHKYGVRIRAISGNDSSYWSPIIRFYTSKSPTSLPPPVIITPIRNALIHAKNVEFNWAALKNAETYDIQVSDEPNFLNFTSKTLIINDSGITTTNYSFDSAKSDFAYYWRVRGRNSQNIGEWSYSFFVTSLETGVSNESYYNAKQIILFPNPASDRFSVGLHLPVEGNVQYEIIDLLGNKIAKNEFWAKTGSNTIQFNCQNYHDGMYIIRLSYMGQTFVKKINILK